MPLPELGPFFLISGPDLGSQGPIASENGEELRRARSKQRGMGPGAKASKEGVGAAPLSCLKGTWQPVVKCSLIW